MGAGNENNPTLLRAGSTLAKCGVFNFYSICKTRNVYYLLPLLRDYIHFQFKYSMWFEFLIIGVDNLKFKKFEALIHNSLKNLRKKLFNMEVLNR